MPMSIACKGQAQRYGTSRTTAVKIPATSMHRCERAAQGPGTKLRIYGFERESGSCLNVEDALATSILLATSPNMMNSAALTPDAAIKAPAT